MLPAWTMPGYLETDADGSLTIGGANAERLAREYGTPLFVFSEGRIKENVSRLQQAAANLRQEVKFCFASKANSNMAVLKVIRDAGIDIEVNSGGELYKALRVGFQPRQIIFNGTSKTNEEIEEAVTADILAINVDSLYEIELVEAAARKLNRRARITLRLVPEIGTRSHIGLQTALLTSKFGISAADVPAAFARALRSPEHLHVCGIHIHVGSQTPDTEPFVEAFRTMWDYLARLHRDTGHRLEHINIGGGIPVNYLCDESLADQLPVHERDMLAASLEPAEVLNAALRVAEKSARETGTSYLLEDLTILLEPGRSVISDAGVVLTTVRNTKRRAETGDTWLLTDAGYNLLLSMNNYKWYYHLISAGRAAAAHDTDYKVAGPLCDSGDVYFDIEGGRRLPDYRKLPANVEPGELLALLNAGAYTLAQMFPYNGRPLPAAVMVRAGGVVDLIRRGESYEDLVTHDVWK
jgi:diaminopimelate decarboxylase